MSKTTTAGYLRAMRDRALAAYMRECVEVGWTLSMNGGNHIRLTPPGGGVPVSVSTTQTEGRATKGAIARIRRAGGPDKRKENGNAR